jgi:uncharacterized damage-inducible protein DinB
MIQALKTLFLRDLNKLRKEIESYKDERNLWIIDKNIANPAGNLCLHLIGNLNTYIGKELGGTGYIRNRDLEFSQKDIPQAELLTMIDRTILAISKALDAVTEKQLEEEYPVIVFADKMTVGFFLVHLLAHLDYHLGQINYHRRLLDV